MSCMQFACNVRAFQSTVFAKHLACVGVLLPAAIRAAAAAGAAAAVAVSVRAPVWAARPRRPRWVELGPRGREHATLACNTRVAIDGGGGDDVRGRFRCTLVRHPHAEVLMEEVSPEVRALEADVRRRQLFGARQNFSPPAHAMRKAVSIEEA